MVAIDDSHQLIVIAFRGTSSLRNRLTDLDFIFTQLPFCDDCLGFAGFWEAWLQASESLKPAVETAYRAHPNYRIVAAGHSYGAAVASFAALQLRSEGYPAHLVWRP